MKRRMEEDRRPIVNIEALREYCEANSLQMQRVDIDLTEQTVNNLK